MDAVNLINCHIFVCSECCGETDGTGFPGSLKHLLD